jgi:hypothetical protein
MKLQLLALAIFCLSATFLHAQESENHPPIDPRVLMHYPLDELTSMSNEKLANITYYYCDSYTIDASNSSDFDIHSFDITLYEKYRLDNEYKTVESNGIKVTLTPKNTAIYLVNYNPKNYRHE